MKVGPVAGEAELVPVADLSMNPMLQKRQKGCPHSYGKAVKPKPRELIFWSYISFA